MWLYWCPTCGWQESAGHYKHSDGYWACACGKRLKDWKQASDRPALRMALMLARQLERDWDFSEATWLRKQVEDALGEE